MRGGGLCSHPSKDTMHQGPLLVVSGVDRRRGEENVEADLDALFSSSRDAADEIASAKAATRGLSFPNDSPPLTPHDCVFDRGAFTKSRGATMMRKSPQTFGFERSEL